MGLLLSDIHCFTILNDVELLELLDLLHLPVDHHLGNGFHLLPGFIYRIYVLFLGRLLLDLL